MDAIIKQISIYSIAQATGIPPRTISLNIKVLENIPAVRKWLNNNE